MGPTLDEPPRGRSPIALKKQQVNRSLNRTRGVDRREMKQPGRAGRSTSQYRHQRRERSRSRSKMAVEALASYPPYSSVPGLFRPGQNLPPRTKGASRPSGRTEMIKGSTCKLIMQLLAQFKTAEKVLSMMMLPQPLAGTTGDEIEYELGDGESDGEDDNGGVQMDATKWHLGKNDVEAIAERCGDLELTGSKPLQVDVEGWGKVVIVKTWLYADTGGMEEKWRDDPIHTGGEEFWTQVGLLDGMRLWQLTGFYSSRKRKIETGIVGRQRVLDRDNIGKGWRRWNGIKTSRRTRPPTEIRVHACCGCVLCVCGHVLD